MRMSFLLPSYYLKIVIVVCFLFTIYATIRILSKRHDSFTVTVAILLLIWLIPFFSLGYISLSAFNNKVSRKVHWKSVRDENRSCTAILRLTNQEEKIVGFGIIMFGEWMIQWIILAPPVAPYKGFSIINRI